MGARKARLVMVAILFPSPSLADPTRNDLRRCLVPMWRPRTVDVVDETFVRARPEAVRAALEQPGLLDLLWPGLDREVVQDRGAKGVRWRAGGEVVGRLEIWLEAAHGGTLVHHFLHGEQRGGPRAWAKVHRRRWKRGMHEIKDRLEGRSR